MCDLSGCCAWHLFNLLQVQLSFGVSRKIEVTGRRFVGALSAALWKRYYILLFSSEEKNRLDGNKLVERK